MDQLGKRIHAVQRADQIRDGHNGRQDDVLEDFHFTVGIKGDFLNDQCIVPGKNGEVYSRKGMTLDRKEFEKMKDEYYQIRGWDVASGLPTRKSLEDLDLKEIADTLDEEGKLGKN
jgi:aldehyde:ferredoxin oxidoreductase